tara:strand:+ start:3785 stop:5353 length:1569 start_codon:yes stop_codon:yes gene_type:complete
VKRVIFNEKKKGLDSDSGEFEKIIPGESENLKAIVEELIKSSKNFNPSPEARADIGNLGDVKVVKTAKNKYNLYIKGEDSWHKDNNSSFGAVDKSPEQNQISVQQSDNGTIEHKFNDVTRFSIDLDAGTVTGVATPILKTIGNLKLQPTGATTVDSTLAVNTIAAADSDTDKFLVSDSGTVKYRTGAQLLSDIGGGPGDITGVTAGNGLTGGGDTGAVSLAVGVDDSTIEINSDALRIKDGGVVFDKLAGAAVQTSAETFVDNDTSIMTSASIQDKILAYGYSTTSGTVTEVTGGTGIDVLNGTTTPAITVDLSELPDGTGSVVGSADEMIYLDNGAQKRKQIDEIKLSQFANDLTAFTTAGGITAGAVAWQFFPFIVTSATNGRHYYIDIDDTANSYRRWDDYDTDPTGFNYRDVAGNFVVPEDCTLVAMHGVIANNSSTNNPTITIYHGAITEAASDTTLASAGAVTPTTGTVRVPFKFSKTDFDTDLAAGDIVVPAISHADTGGTRSFTGSLTLKFVTR